MKSVNLLTSVVAFCLIFATASSNAQEKMEAPFGLEWGSTPEEISNLGVSMEIIENENGLRVYVVDSLPNNLANVEYYMLLIDEDYGLQKIGYVGENIKNDPYGTKGKKEFARLADIVQKRFPIVTGEYMRVGEYLYDEEDEFYQCLAYEGCGNWIRFFENEQDEKMLLDLNGVSRGEGYISINIEGPFWDDAFAAIESRKNSADSEAF